MYGEADQPTASRILEVTLADARRTTNQFCAGLFRNTTYEFQFLAACCRWPTECAEEEIRGLLSVRAVDWKLLLSLGKRHRVGGLLAAALRRQEGVPAQVLAALAGPAEQIERENLLQIAVSVSVTRALQREHVPVIVLKGAPLARTVYGNTSVRHSKDIDLLVKREHVETAKRVMLANGFKQGSSLAQDLTPQQVRSYERYRKNYDFTHSATGCQVELHWRAFDNTRLGSVEVDDAEWIECSPGMHLPALRSGDLFSLLCAHGAGHAWFRMKWAADVAALLAKSTPEEQSILLRYAQQRGLERPAEQAWLLCSSLFRDGRITEPKRSTTVGRWLATVARDALQQHIPARSGGTEFVPKRLAASRLLLRRGWSYRLEEAKVYAVSPADWKTLRLPPWLHFAYPLVRVPLWLRRQWSRRRFRSSHS